MCNEEQNVVTFLNDKSPSIKKTNIIIQKLSSVINNIKNLSKPSILFDSTNTRKDIPIVSSNFSESSIYKSFITYCAFNKQKILATDLMELCIDNKSSFDSNSSIEDKITILKEEGKFYSIEMLHQLHAIIQQKLSISNEKYMITNENFNNLLQELDNYEVPNVDKDLISLLISISNQKDAFVVNDTKPMRDIKNYLIENIDILKDIVKTFLTKNSKKKITDKIDKFITSITNIYNKTHNILTGDDQNMFDNTEYLLKLFT